VSAKSYLCSYLNIGKDASAEWLMSLRVVTLECIGFLFRAMDTPFTAKYMIKGDRPPDADPGWRINHSIVMAKARGVADLTSTPAPPQTTQKPPDETILQVTNLECGIDKTVKKASQRSPNANAQSFVNLTMFEPGFLQRLRTISRYIVCLPIYIVELFCKTVTLGVYYKG
jgi:hypothetical protein